MSDFEPKSILVYVGGHADNALGENLIKLPFLLALRKRWPNARLTWIPGLGPSQFDGPLKRLARPLVDELITDLDIPQDAMELLRLRRPLPDRHFDLIIDTQRVLARTLAMRRISHQRFISGTWKFFFSDRKPPGRRAQSQRLIDKLLVLLDAAAEEVVEAPFTAPLPETERTAAEIMLPHGPEYVGIAPGAGRRDTGKLWPLDRFVALGHDQATKGRTPVYILGPDEADWRPKIAEQVPEALFPLQAPLPGDAPMSPALTVALASKLKVGVANCSGTGHMMALGGVPMVSLFAPSKPEKYAPHAVTVTALRAQDYGSSAIDAIPLDAVVDAVDRHFKGMQDPTRA